MHSQPVALFPNLTYLFDVSFGNFLLWNTNNFLVENISFYF
jgi:hypothetical protein